jgi:hypothetical protein
MLSSDDFLSAIRVDKQFYAARLKKSAWPTLHLDSFIQSLRDDDYDDPARRRLHFRVPSHRSSRHAGRAAVFRSLTQAGWRYVTDVRLYDTSGGQQSSKHATAADLVVPELASLSCLTAVNLQLAFCIVVAPTLQVLLFESTRVENEIDPLTHVGLLHELRVLVVDQCPPLQSLLQLHRLVYLYLNRSAAADEQQRAEVAATLRHLSSSYALRSLSLVYPATWMLDGLLATAPPAILSAQHAALIDWSQPIHLTDLSFAACISRDLLQRCTTIPTLTRLQASMGKSRWDLTPIPRLTVFARLQQLRLQFRDATLLTDLARCTLIASGLRSRVEARPEQCMHKEKRACAGMRVAPLCAPARPLSHSNH